MSTLHQDSDENPPQFVGAQLNMDDSNLPEVDFKDPNISRDRPFSASVTSRHTSASTASRASRSLSVAQTQYSVKGFFSYRPSALEKAIEDSVQELVKTEVDGEIKGSWLLTEIDHWDCEYEKVVILTDYSLIIVRYDFVSLKIYKYFKIRLELIHSVEIGKMIYPEKSFMPPRDHGGIRVHYGKEELSFGQRWNPFCKTLPYFTFTYHPLIYYKDEAETATYNVDDFFDTLVAATKSARQANNVDGDLKVLEKDILVETYVSLASLVHNQSQLGFSRERGGISY